MMAADENKLKLGKGVAFVKSRLRQLPQEDETWEADFRTLPQPGKIKGGYHVGMVVTQPHGFLRAMLEIERIPTVNDLATMLAEAMKRPLINAQHRPRCIELRKNSMWEPLFPALKELGIEVVVKPNLRQVNEVFAEFLNPVQQVRPGGRTKPTKDQAAVETLFPAIAKWVNGYGHIEIGDQDGFGFIVRALSYGGLVFESKKPKSFAEAMAALEKALADYFEEQGIEE